MKHKRKIVVLIFLAAFAMILSVWGPETLAKYQDRGTLNEIHLENVEEAGTGYRYRLSMNEKMYILSRCLGSWTLPESEQSVLARNRAVNSANGGMYQDTDGSYAFVANYRDPSDTEITDEQIYETCNDAIASLKEAGILPDEVREVEPSAYDATLYSAIDVLEPRNNIAVWKLALSNSQKNADKENRLMDAYIGAEDGKLYEFYVRTPLLWSDIDTDQIIGEWSRYMGIGTPEPYESDNPLLETTPYFKKYVFAGMGEERTIVTVGFYEGINELFLKIE